MSFDENLPVFLTIYIAFSDLQKKLETEEAKTAKFKDNLEKEKAETTRLTAVSFSIRRVLVTNRKILFIR